MRRFLSAYIVECLPAGTTKCRLRAGIEIQRRPHPRCVVSTADTNSPAASTQAVWPMLLGP